MTLPKLIGVALAALLLIAPAARAEVLDPVDGFHVAALDGTRLWNHEDPDSRYTLVDGDGQSLGLKRSGRYTPFDVSLGTDTEGRLLAVYSRCVGIESCSLYADDLATATERSLGLKGKSPALSDGVLAYARGRSLYIGRLGTTPHRIAHVDDRGFEGMSIASSARGVAFASDSDIGTTLYFKPAGGAVRRLAHAGLVSQDGGHMSPVWHDGRLYWAFKDYPRSWVIRYSLSSHRADAAPVRGELDSLAFDGPTLITSVAFDERGQVATFDAPAWGRAPARAGLGR